MADPIDPPPAPVWDQGGLWVHMRDSQVPVPGYFEMEHSRNSNPDVGASLMCLLGARVELGVNFTGRCRGPRALISTCALGVGAEVAPESLTGPQCPEEAVSQMEGPQFSAHSSDSQQPGWGCFRVRGVLGSGQAAVWGRTSCGWGSLAEQRGTGVPGSLPDPVEGQRPEEAQLTNWE